MKITVVGLGKLGLPFAALIAQSGYEVSGLDLSLDRLEDIRELRIESEPKVRDLVHDQLNKNLTVTDNWKDSLIGSEISFIIVPTPSDASGKFKNDYVCAAITKILDEIRDNQDHIICIVSTVMPGSCLSEFEPLVAKHPRSQKNSIDLAYSPEFIALGTIVQNMLNPDLILIGESKNSVGDKLIKVLSSFSANSPKICRMSLSSAELAKIAINTFVTSKISYANMIAEIADSLDDVNKYDVLQAVGSDSRVGPKYLKPGLGFGGPCFPRDNRALNALADTFGIPAELASATEAVNLRQPDIQIKKIQNKLRGDCKRILFLGMAYKPGSYVTEESQALMIAVMLAKMGHDVSVHDPLVTLSDIFKDGVKLKQITTPEEIGYFDLAILAVDWPQYESFFAAIEESRRLRIS